MFPDKFRIGFLPAYTSDFTALRKMGVTWLLGGPQPGNVTVADYHSQATAAGFEKVTLGFNFTTDWSANPPAGTIGQWNNLSDPLSYGTHGLDELPSNNYYCRWSAANAGLLVPAYLAAQKTAARPFFQVVDHSVASLPDVADDAHPYSKAQGQAVAAGSDVGLFDDYMIATGRPVTAAPASWQAIIDGWNALSGSKPFIGIVEVQAQPSQGANRRAPTAQEVSFEMGLMAAMGSRGIVLFPDAGATLQAAPEVQAAVAKFAAMVKAHQSVFDAPPGTVTTTGTVYSSTRNGVTLAANNSTSPAQFMGVTLAPLDFQLIGTPPAPTPAPAVQYATEAEMKAVMARVAVLENHAGIRSPR